MNKIVYISNGKFRVINDARECPFLYFECGVCNIPAWTEKGIACDKSTFPDNCPLDEITKPSKCPYYKRLWGGNQIDSWVVGALCKKDQSVECDMNGKTFPKDCPICRV